MDIVKQWVMKYATQIVMDSLASWLTPEKVDEGKVKLVEWMRKMVKEQTPDFPLDDQVVEIIAKAFKVK